MKPTRTLIAIIVVSVVLRVGVAFIMGNRIEPLPGIQDQQSYHMLAQRVLQGHGFTVAEDWWPLTRAGEATAHWSYLYTLYLVGVYAVFGAQPLGARLLQALIVGILWPLLAYRLGRRLAGETTGLVAAGWSAAYPYFVYYGAALMTEPFYITAILASLELALTMAAQSVEPAGRGRTAGRWALLGLILGIAVLLRQLFLVFVPFLVGYVWIAQLRRSLQPGAGRLARRIIRPAAQSLLYPAIAVGVIALLIAPWTVRNAVAFNRFVLLNTNAGFAFFWANHPVYGAAFVGILPADTPYESLIPRELRSLSEAEMDSALMGKGLEFVLQDPLRYIQLSISRIAAYFMFWPSGDSTLFSNVARVLSFAVALPFIVYGLIVAARRWRAWVLLYLFVGVYTAIHLLSWALVRYRLPVDAVFLVFAAYGVVDAGHKLRRAVGKVRPALRNVES